MTNRKLTALKPHSKLKIEPILALFVLVKQLHLLLSLDGLGEQRGFTSLFSEQQLSD